MKRVNFEVKDEINYAAARTYGSEFCHNHPTYKVISWCQDHEISLCMVCLKLDHAKCNKVESIEEAIQTTNSNAELKSLKKRVDDTRNAFRKLVKDRDVNIEALEAQKEVLKNDVRNFKQKVIQHLDRLEFRLEKETSLLLDRHKHKLEDQIFEFKKRDETLKGLFSDLRLINEDTTANQTVLFLKEANVVQNKQEEFLKDNVGSLKNISVQLQMNDKIRKILDLSEIGSVQTIESTSTNTPDLQKSVMGGEQDAEMLIKVEESVKEYNMHNYTFVPETEIDVRPTFASSALVPEITGGMMLQDGRLFVVDRNNKRLLGYTAKGLLAKETYMEDEPYAMTYFDVNKFLLTVPNQHRIEIRDYGALQYADKIEINHKVSGIASQDDVIVVVCENHGILSLNSEGKIGNRIPMKGNKEGPVHLQGDIVCYAESKKGTLHVLRLSGEVVFTTTVKGLGYVQGVIVLRDSSILVSKSSPGNKAVWHYSPDGHQQALREEFVVFKSPRAIVYEKKTKKLYVAHGVRRVSLFREIKG